ncbi:LCP family protein [Actinocorallia longicatena]|uniref:LytR family transcriptional attenuator n=1 Tax=Actinocorallia longicatena TaxID=111803 RepID=A0ABP6QMF9_9ACTN
MNSPLYTDYVDDTQSERAKADQDTQVVSRGWKLLGWTSVALSGLLVVGSISAYGYTRYLTSGLEHLKVDDSIKKAVPKLNNAVNILLMGSDTRDGANAKYGKSLVGEAARADTTILMHISPGGGAVTGISFPRDLMVDIPACKTPNGGMSAPQKNMINSAFSIGGPTCTWKTIQTLTNIHIDHMAVVDFAGFKGVVNSLGGIEICLTKDVDDDKSKLHLKKGRHVVKGEQALAYVRARHGLGDGSDLSRVKRQQQFLSSVANKAMSKSVLSDPFKLTSLLRSLTRTIKVDDDFSLKAMVDLGTKMKGLDVKKVKFVTVPYTAYAPDPNRVAFRQPDADDFFAEVANDKKLVETNPKPSVTVPPAQIKVRVYNGSEITGKAQSVANELKAKGYQVPLFGNPKVNPPETQILYGKGGENAAATLAVLVPGAKPVPSTKTPAGVVDLVLGPNWTGLTTGSALPKKLDGEIKATDNICKAT